ncbi:MAG: YIP1 family protein [Bernardetiaceae bacterium]|nr:YIP1 family protein [Bernardetiaceae bacterium]
MAEEILDEIEETRKFTDKEIFLHIWTAPRAVFEYIDKYQYSKHIIVLLMLAGISNAFDRAANNNSGDAMSLWGVIASALLLGGVSGWISYYIYAGLVSWTGKLVDGQGNTKSILNVLAYASVPSILSLLLLVIQIALYGNGVFQEDPDFMDSNEFATILFYGSMFLELILVVWTLVLSIIAISVAQKISIPKAIANALFPVLLLIIIVLLFILVFKILQ